MLSAGRRGRQYTSGPGAGAHVISRQYFAAQRTTPTCRAPERARRRGRSAEPLRNPLPAPARPPPPAAPPHSTAAHARRLWLGARLDPARRRAAAAGPGRGIAGGAGNSPGPRPLTSPARGRGLGHKRDRPAGYLATHTAC